MSSAAPLELVTDDQYEYLYLEEEEDIHSNDSNSDDDTKLSDQNAQDIFYLIRHNKKKYIKYRLNSNYPLKVNTTNNTRITPIMSATIFRRHGILRILLARPEIRVNSFDEHSMSALLYAASNGDQRCLKYLLSAGADPAHFNTERRNVLHLLILRRHFNSVLYLLEFPNDEVQKKIRAVINVPDVFGMTPLLYACELGHRNLAKYLVQCGANFKQHDNLGRDCLSHSIQSKDHSLVQYFIHELGFDTNRVYEQCRGFTPLFYATAADSPELIMLLLDAGAKIDAIDGILSETPMLYAARIGKVNSLNTLLFCGANPNAANKNGTTALLELVKHDLRDQLYYVYGIQQKIITPLSPFDTNAIYEASNQIGQYELYKHLKALRDNEGYSSLIHAVLGDNSEAVTFLLKDVGCDIHQGDNQQRSPLYHAVANRHVRLFELLIDAGANYDTRDQDNNTVLMHAADSNNTSFVHSLIQRGADLTVMNRSKWSVLSFTCKTGNFDLFKSIIEELRVRFSDPANTCSVLSQSHLSLCLNVACTYGRPATSGINSQRQHANIAAVIVARTQAVSQGVSGTELLRGCQFANPNEIFPDLEPSIIAAVRNSGDNPTIVDYLFQSPNGVNPRVTDSEGYTPTLLAVRLQYHNVIRRILQYESSKTSSSSGAGAAPQQHAASAELRCPAGLSPSDHACIIRHDKTFTEVRKRSRAVTEQKKNKYGVSTGELLALGQNFSKYLKHLYEIQLPYVTNVSKGSEMLTVTPTIPSANASANEQVLTEIDIIWLAEREESNVREGFSIITSLFELQIPEQSTYTPKTLSENGNYIVPLVPRELVEEMDLYSNFLKSASIVEPFIEVSNTSRPSKQIDIPSYRHEAKSLLYVTVVGSKNLPLFLSLIQCNVSAIGSSTEAMGLGLSDNSGASGSTPSDAATPSPLSPSPLSPAARPGMPAARPGMPAARPGMPAARPGMPAARPGMPAARPGMPAARPGAVSTVASPGVNRLGALRTDNINNENSTLLEILFAYAGYEGASVAGTNFLITAIIAAKYCPFWDEEFVFVGYNTKYPEKCGKTIQQLATDYKIPQAYEIAKKTMYDIEQHAKENKKHSRI